MRDFRQGIRLLARSPGFSAAAILILALGIGANTAIFSVVNALVLQPRPGRVDELQTVHNRHRSRPDDYRDFSYPLYTDLRERRDIFERLAARTFGLVGIEAGEVMKRSFVEVVSSNYFTTLGVSLAAGRPFTPEEERPGANAAVVIASYGTWRRHGFDAAFVGSAVRVNGIDHTIVGVAPRRFAGTMSIMAPEWWFPLGNYDVVVNEMFRQKATGLADRSNHALTVTAALRPGLDPEAVVRTLDDAALRLAQQFPDTERDRVFELSGVPRLGVSTRPRPHEEAQIVAVAGLLALMAALVLAVACLNLATLLLARGSGRRREIAIRQALGSGRLRIVQQLFVEGLTLSLCGAAAGLIGAWWSTRALGAWLAGALPVGIQLVVEPSPRMLPAAAAFAVGSTLVFALVPAWRISRPAVVDDLKGTPSQVGRFRAGTILVSAQLALSLALVAVGGLFMRSAANVAAGSAGFALDRHLVVALDPSLAGYSEARTRTLYGAVLERVRALPGVERASLASMVPFGEFRESKLASLPGEPETTEANFTIVTSDYFDTLRVPVLRGRGFDGADDERQADLPSAVVNDPLARRLFGDVDPVGRLVDVRQGPEVQRFLVTGVVPGTAMDLFDAEPAPHLYVPYGSRFRAAMTLHVATAPDADETAVLGVIRRALRELDPQLPVLSARTMSSQRDASLTHWASRAAAVMFSAFSALALLLATIGVYGLKAYDVARRTRELAIRIALGATSGDVARLVVADGLGPAAVGLLAGLLLALALGQLASSFLFRVNPYDAVTLAAACLVLGGVTAAAAYLPARRAVRIAPLEALRAE